MAKIPNQNPGFAEERQSGFSNPVASPVSPSSYFRARVTDGGRLVIPSDIRKAMELSIGDEVVMTLRNGVLEIVPQLLAIRKIQAELATYKRSEVDVVEEFLTDRRTESRLDETPSDEAYWTKKGNVD